MGRRIKFGPFELDRQTGELWKHGLKVKLQGKPFQILVALLEQPGQPVSREVLQQRLWAGDTFVDFDSGLNTAANRLRITLGDSAENPRYVETMARSGYRFVAQVEEVTAAPAPLPIPPHTFPLRWTIALALLVTIAAAALWWTVRRPVPDAPKFQQMTFRRGPIGGARFTPDGQTILYSARWESEPWRLFLASSVSPETRTVGFNGAKLNAVSRSGELLLLFPENNNAGGTLSRVPLNGGAPLAVSSKVTCSDWSADGKQIAVARYDGRQSQIEFPIGKTIYKTAGLVGCIMVSRDGNSIAFVEHTVRGDDGGDIKVTGLAGTVRTLAAGWASAGGLAWSPSGQEIWFTAARVGGSRALWAVTLAGKLRLVARVPGSLTLQDISKDGRVLLTREDKRVEMAGRVGGDTAERDLSWFDWTGVQDLSADGNLVLFDESGDGGGPKWTVYLRRIQDGSTLRLGEGHALALSPDGRSAATLDPADRHHLKLVPVGEGQTRELAGGNIEYHWARYFPDGQRLLVAGGESSGGIRLYQQSVIGGKPIALTPEIFLRYVEISPDGKWIAGSDPDARLVIRSVEGGELRPVVTTQPLFPVRWSSDGRTLLVRDFGRVPAKVYRIDVATGRSKLWTEIGPTNLTGIQNIYRLFCTPDERSYVYSFDRMVAQLYLADGLR
jgi:DNA-binding winged helix-turn-helix (wHTH) protein/Tol biopolymer transport system component